MEHYKCVYKVDITAQDYIKTISGDFIDDVMRDVNNVTNTLQEFDVYYSLDLTVELYSLRGSEWVPLLTMRSKLANT